MTPATKAPAASGPERPATRPLKVLVADDEAETREFLQELLTRAGHQVAVARDGRQLVELCRQSPPDLVIADIRMPDMDGIQAAETINRDREVPVILITGFHDPQTMSRAVVDHVMAYLVKPVKAADVETAVVLAMQRFEQYKAVRKEAADLRQALEDRKIIERAKGVVCKRLRLDEDEAFRRLRKLASDRNQKLVEVAQQVVAAEQIFHELELR